VTTMAGARTGTLASRYPLIFYFALTYAISWPLWLLSRLAGGTLLTTDSPPVDAVLLATYLLAAGVLISLTRGPLGFRPTERPVTTGKEPS
jgi:hypothetical protein